MATLQAFETPDVMMAIFQWSAPADGVQFLSSNSRAQLRQAPVSVSQVCRSWRRIALDQHSLWSHFEIKTELVLPPFDWIKTENAIQLWLERSANCPLTVRLSLCTLDVQVERALVDRILEHRHRWRDVQVGFQAMDMIGPGVNGNEYQVDLSGMPMLENLSWRAGPLWNIDGGMVLDVSESPRLKGVTIIGRLRVELGGRKLDRFVKYHHYPNARNIGPDVPTEDIFGTIQLSCSSLQSLRIELSQGTEPATAVATKVVSLPELCNIAVYSDDGYRLSAFLSVITASSALANATFDVRGDIFPHQLAEVVRFLGRSNASLRNLSLNYLSADPSNEMEFAVVEADILRASPLLEVLHMERRSMMLGCHVATIIALTVTGEGMLCPLLQTIDFKSNPPLSDTAMNIYTLSSLLVDMILARWRTPARALSKVMIPRGSDAEWRAWVQVRQCESEGLSVVIGNRSHLDCSH